MKHQARTAPWSPRELREQLSDVVDGIIARKGLAPVSPLDVALELLDGELEAFVLFCRIGHLDPPRADGKVPIGILQCASSDPEVDARIRETARTWVLGQGAQS